MTGHRKIGVLLGGLSAERDVSIRSGEAILAALADRGYDAAPIFVDRDIDLLLRQTRIDVAFLALHGRYGEDGCVQGMLEVLGIPYTCSGVLASGLAMNKGKAKEIFRLHNLPTAPGYVIQADSSSSSSRATRMPRDEPSPAGLTTTGNPNEPWLSMTSSPESAWMT